MAKKDLDKFAPELNSLIGVLRNVKNTRSLGRHPRRLTLAKILNEKGLIKMINLKSKSGKNLGITWNITASGKKMLTAGSTLGF